MQIEVVKNPPIDARCPAGEYVWVTVVDDFVDHRAERKQIAVPISDPRLKRFLKAVDRLKCELGLACAD